MQAEKVEGDDYCLIVCKAGNQALKIQQTGYENIDKSNLQYAQPNTNDDSQLFMFNQVNNLQGQVEIVHCQSDLVFEIDKKQIRLRRGKQDKDQLFVVVESHMHKYYWIKTDTQGDKALSMEGIVRFSQFDPNNETQLFRFQPAMSPIVRQSAILINNFSNKALDVPGATKKQGERIVQWQKNKRWNQRWCFQIYHKGFVIKNVLTGLVLDIAGQSRENGAKVIQWELTGRPNQQWFAEPAEKGIYRFRSCHDPSLFLAIKKQDVADGGQLQVCWGQNPSMYWKCEGAQP